MDIGPWIVNRDSEQVKEAEILDVEHTNVLIVLTTASGTSSAAKRRKHPGVKMKRVCQRMGVHMISHALETQVQTAKSFR